MEAWWSRATAVRGLIRFSGPGRADRSTSVVTWLQQKAANGGQRRWVAVTALKKSHSGPFYFCIFVISYFCWNPSVVKTQYCQTIVSTSDLFRLYWKILILNLIDWSVANVLSCPALSFIYDSHLSDLWILASVTAMLLLRPWIFRRCCRRNQDDLEGRRIQTQRESDPFRRAVVWNWVDIYTLNQLIVEILHLFLKWILWAEQWGEG